MGRWWSLWLVLGGALSAQGSESIAYDLDPAAGCPTPVQLRSAVESQIGGLLPSGEGDWLERPALRVRPGPDGTLVAELIGPLSRRSFRRSIPSASCEAQAQAVALLVRSWLDKEDEGSEAAVERTVVVHEARPTSPGPPLAPAGPPVIRSRLSWEPRLSGGELLASTPSPLGGSIEGSLQLYLTRRWGVALRGAWMTSLHAGDPESAGSLELRRYAFGLDASWTGRPLPDAMDIALGLQDELDQTIPTGYLQENQAVTQTLQVHLAVRYRWFLVSGLFAYAEASGTVGLWPQRFLAADTAGEVPILTLPEIQLALDLGLGWHFL
jgi:hypothetical protein